MSHTVYPEILVVKKFTPNHAFKVVDTLYFCIINNFISAQLLNEIFCNFKFMFPII